MEDKSWRDTLEKRPEQDEFDQIVAETAPDADGWIEWNGGECPVERGTLVDVRFKDGMEMVGTPAGQTPDHLPRNMTAWACSSAPGAIIAYRLHKAEQAKPRFCKSVMRSIPEPEAKPTIEQLAAEYRSAKNYADRKQEEADDAKADADVKLKELELAGEALGLLVSPITANQESELAIEVKVDDEVRCIKSTVTPDKYMWKVGTVFRIDDSSPAYLVDFGGKKVWCHKVKFIRRP